MPIIFLNMTTRAKLHL